MPQNTKSAKLSVPCSAVGLYCLLNYVPRDLTCPLALRALLTLSFYVLYVICEFTWSRTLRALPVFEPTCNFELFLLL